MKVFLLLILFGSCSLHRQIKNFDQGLALPTLKPDLRQMSCSQESNSNLSAVGISSTSTQQFLKLLKKHDSNNKYSFIERSILWSLIQMNERPDLVSPSSSWQIILRQNDKKKYWHFHGGRVPYLMGMQEILNYYKQPHSLLQLARFLDKILPNKIPISLPFSQFIARNQTELLKVPYFSKTLFKVDEPLKEGESIPKLNFKNVVQKQLKENSNEKEFLKSQHLFNFSPSQDIKAQCNFDLNLYKRSIFLIAKEQNDFEVHKFGLQMDAKNYFLAVASQVPDLSSINSKQLLFKPLSHPPPSALCFVDINKSDKAFALLSSRGRDPGQHIFNFLDNKLSDINNISNIENLIKAPRQLTLVAPKRLLLEAARTDQTELENILYSVKIPIYNVDKIGSIWAHSNLSSKEYGFVTDLRYPNGISCAP